MPCVPFAVPITGRGEREKRTSQAASDSTSPVLHAAGAVANSRRRTSPAVCGLTVAVATTRYGAAVPMSKWNQPSSPRRTVWGWALRHVISHGYVAGTSRTDRVPSPGRPTASKTTVIVVSSSPSANRYDTRSIQATSGGCGGVGPFCWNRTNSS